jgi:hypothetical protein
VTLRRRISESRERVILAIGAGIYRKRARLAIGKPKILGRAGLPFEFRQQTRALPAAKSSSDCRRNHAQAMAIFTDPCPPRPIPIRMRPNRCLSPIVCASSSRNIQRRVLSAHLLPHRDRDDINDRPDRGLRAYRRGETAALVCRTGLRILRRYRPNTLVLETEFATAEGEVVRSTSCRCASKSRMRCVWWSENAAASACAPRRRCG